MKTYQKVPAKTQRECQSQEKGHPKKDCRASWVWRRGLIGKVLSAFGKRINWNWAPPMALIRIWCAVNGGTKRGRRASVGGRGKRGFIGRLRGYVSNQIFESQSKFYHYRLPAKLTTSANIGNEPARSHSGLQKGIHSMPSTRAYYNLFTNRERGGQRGAQGIHINI